MLRSLFVTNSFPVQSQSVHILIDNANGGAIFAFVAKIGLKSAKQVVLCMPVGGAIAPFRPRGYATDCLYVLLN